MFAGKHDRQARVCFPTRFKYWLAMKNDVCLHSNDTFIQQAVCLFNVKLSKFISRNKKIKDPEARVLTPPMMVLLGRLQKFI